LTQRISISMRRASVRVAVVLCTILVLLVARYVVLEVAPDLVFNAYVFMFAAAATVSHLASGGDLLITLAVAMAVVYGRVVYRYLTKSSVLLDVNGLRNTAMFAMGLVASAGVAGALVPFRDTWALHMVLFLMVVYTIASVLEWCVHKYVMHCFTHWPWLIAPEQRGVGALAHMQESCLMHRKHHLSVQSDMTLRTDGNHDDDDDRGDLVFYWSTLATSAVVMVALALSVVALLRLRIPLWQQAPIVALTIVGFGFAWNTVHPDMHETHVDLPLNVAPPSLSGGVVAPLSSHSLLYRNHETHHQVKGPEKGNYNVVFLAADELFLTNRMIT
jgi:hypothetical protein